MRDIRQSQSQERDAVRSDDTRESTRDAELSEEGCLRTDGGAAWTDLTGFQRDVLKAIRRCNGDGNIPTGQTIKEYLEPRYMESINNGRLYQNLDELVDRGLLEKGFVDGRTNTYNLTEETNRMLDRMIHRFADDCGLTVKVSESPVQATEQS